MAARGNALHRSTERAAVNDPGNFGECSENVAYVAALLSPPCRRLFVPHKPVLLQTGIAGQPHAWSLKPDEGCREWCRKLPLGLT